MECVYLEFKVCAYTLAYIAKVTHIFVNYEPASDHLFAFNCERIAPKHLSQHQKPFNVSILFNVLLDLKPHPIISPPPPSYTP